MPVEKNDNYVCVYNNSLCVLSASYAVDYLMHILHRMYIHNLTIIYLYFTVLVCTALEYIEPTLSIFFFLHL